MHYDIDSGAKDTRGLFSRLTVISITVVLEALGLYSLVNWFAPDIFFYVSDNRAAIENGGKTQPVAGDMLRVPSLEIEREIVPKKADGLVQLTSQGDRLILSGAARSLGVTPFDTKNLSPLALLGRALPDTKIYLDFGGVRQAYRASEVFSGTQPSLSPASDLVIYALTPDGKTAVTEVRAEKLGEVKI